MRLQTDARVILTVFCSVLFCGSAHAVSFTIPESVLLGTEFNTKAWGPATVVRQNVPGDAVQFSFTGLGGSGTGLKDNYAVLPSYGQVLPSHGNGDFSNFDGYSLWVKNLDDASVWMSLFINTGYTGDSGNPANTWQNDTFWQSSWSEIPAGQSVPLHLDFGNAIPWNIADNPSPHTQGANGVAKAINNYDRTQVSAIGFETVQLNGNTDARILVSPTPIPDQTSTLVLLGSALAGAGLVRQLRRDRKAVVH